MIERFTQRRAYFARIFALAVFGSTGIPGGAEAAHDSINQYVKRAYAVVKFVEGGSALSNTAVAAKRSSVVAAMMCRRDIANAATVQKLGEIEAHYKDQQERVRKLIRQQVGRLNQDRAGKKITAKDEAAASQKIQRLAALLRVLVGAESRVFDCISKEKDKKKTGGGPVPLIGFDPGLKQLPSPSDPKVARTNGGNRNDRRDGGTGAQNTGASSCIDLVSASTAAIGRAQREAGKGMRDAYNELENVNYALGKIASNIRELQENLAKTAIARAKELRSELQRKLSEVIEEKGKLQEEMTRLISEFSLVLGNRASWPAKLSADFKRRQSAIQNKMNDANVRLNKIQRQLELAGEQDAAEARFFSRAIRLLEQWEAKRAKLLERIPGLKDAARKYLKRYNCTKKLETKLAVGGKKDNPTDTVPDTPPKSAAARTCEGVVSSLLNIRLDSSQQQALIKNSVGCKLPENFTYYELCTCIVDPKYRTGYTCKISNTAESLGRVMKRLNDGRAKACAKRGPKSSACYPTAFLIRSEGPGNARRKLPPLDSPWCNDPRAQ